MKYSEGMAAQKLVGKDRKSSFGFVNHKGKVVIPYQYDTVYSVFRHGMCAVGKNNKATVINKKGKEVIPFNFKEIGEISKSIIPVKSDSGFWGFYSESGEKILDPAYTNYRYGGKHRLMLQQYGKWGMVSNKGKSLVEFNYRGIQQINDKEFSVWNANQWTVRDASNKVLFSVNFDSLKYAGERKFKFAIIGNYGLLDDKGKVIAEPVYDEIGYFRNGLIKVKKKNYGVINALNRVVIPFEYDDIILDSLYIRAKVTERNEDGAVKEKWALFDYKGNKLIQPKYAKMNSLSDGFIAAMREDGTWGYVDPKGNTEVIFRYSSAEDFKNGLAKVSVPYSLLKKDHPAIIDKTGEYVISPADYEFYSLGLIKIDYRKKASYVVPKDKYQSYEKFNQRYVKVGLNGKFGVITTDGVEIIPPVYDNVSAPSETGIFVVEKNGKSAVMNNKGVTTCSFTSKYEKIYGFTEGFSKVMLKGKYGFIDSYCNVWISPQYPEAGTMSDSMVYVQIRGKWGFMDHRENLKVQPYYEEVTPFTNGISLVKENGKWNIVNKEGKELHQTNYDYIEKTSTGNYLLGIGDKVGLADRKGRELFPPRYEKIVEAGKGYVLVKKNGLWGVLDLKQNFIVPIEFDVVYYEASDNLFITGTVGKQEKIHVK